MIFSPSVRDSVRYHLRSRSQGSLCRQMTVKGNYSLQISYTRICLLRAEIDNYRPNIPNELSTVMSVVSDDQWRGAS